MTPPSKRYLLAYLLITIIFWTVTTVIIYLLWWRRVARTTRRVLRTATNADLVSKAGCATLIANVDAPRSGTAGLTTVIQSLYPPQSAGVQRCREILAENG